MSKEKYRSRAHMLLLYPDNEAHAQAMDIIKKSYDHLAILHNKDVTEDGELKKEHWHVVLRFNQAKWSSAICKELGIEERFIEDVKKFDNALQYLIHYNDENKAQYRIEETFGTLQTKLKESIQKIDKSEGEKVLELISYIEDKNDIVTIKDFASWCAKNGYWAEFRRSATIFVKIIEEHNRIYYEDKGTNIN